MEEPFIPWSAKLELGIVEIDEQHRCLVDMVNEVHKAVLFHDNLKVCDVLDEMTDYTRIHFAIEETMLHSLGYPELEEHQSSHHDLLEQLEELAYRVSSGAREVNRELMEILRHWLLDHILEEDVKYCRSNAMRPLD